MFSNKRPDETSAQKSAGTAPKPPSSSPEGTGSGRQPTAPSRIGKKSMASTLSNDLTIVGKIKSESEIKVEGHIDGELVAKLIEIGNEAVIKGKISADEIVVNGHIKGKIRGVKVRLNKGARVEGDIIHETIAIEAGAHFEGAIKRQENPLVDPPKTKSPPNFQPRGNAPNSARATDNSKERFAPPGQQNQATKDPV